jgi:hypothetical protein
MRKILVILPDFRPLSQQNLFPVVTGKGLSLLKKMLFSNRWTARKGRSLPQDQSALAVPI